MEIHQKSFAPLSRILRLIWVFSGIGLAILSGCSHMELENAFKGDLRPGKANKITVTYTHLTLPTMA